jgi:hypothetical protein
MSEFLWNSGERRENSGGTDFPHQPLPARQLMDPHPLLRFALLHRGRITLAICNLSEKVRTARIDETDCPLTAANNTTAYIRVKLFPPFLRCFFAN